MSEAMPNAAIVLSAEALAAIDYEVAKYPAGKQASAVMSALRIAQKEKGYLANETIEYVAAYLSIPAIRAFEVATFYNMYDLKPVGQNKLCLCTNLPCMLNGALKTAAELKKQLGIDFGETTADGEWTLKEGECFGACAAAPAIIVNNEKMFENITPDKVATFLQEVAEQNQNKPAAQSQSKESTNPPDKI
ncbi:MAG: NADH-quinone oxidoreductase subunit NuoE [Proteobacteria bacterium]|nr:NADH-quinone oxidoreductase subunit NuoE [Pseudomonadota bacterium]